MIWTVKIAIVIGLCALGWGMDGSYKGAIGWFGVIMFVWVLWIIGNDMSGTYPQKASRKFQADDDFIEEPQGPSRRGERLNPDPTRPTLDDYAGLITTYIERKR